jgi:hypothetical protein
MGKVVKVKCGRVMIENGAEEEKRSLNVFSIELMGISRAGFDVVWCRVKCKDVGSCLSVEETCFVKD